MTTADATPRGSKRLIILGSTGSIGAATLDVVSHLHATTAHRFNVVGLAAGRRSDAVREQARRYHVGHVALADEGAAATMNEDGLTVHAGPDAARELVDAVAEPGDLVVGAIVGAAGLPAILAAIERGCDVALANKETLVAAGALVMPRVAARGVRLLPVDSEHSAIFQALAGDRDPDHIRRIVLTASGGPFRTWSKTRIENASLEAALDHPTWSMGEKVTIDSASMMNKALEVIEAHWLFDLPASRIETIVHPASIVHGFVEYVDGSVLAQLSPPDMRTPIQHALLHPERGPAPAATLDWTTLATLEFEPVDHDRFPAIRLAEQAIERGGSAGAVFNASNEAAVEAFRAGRTTFGRIAELVAEALTMVEIRPIQDLADVRAADEAARAFVESRLEAAASRS